MPGAPISVDPEEYVTAGDGFFAVDGLVCDIVAAAAVGAAGGDAMAGCDSSGVAWARDYDTAARAALQAGAALADTLGHVGTLLSTSGANHADADAASQPGGPPAYPGSGDGGRGGGAASVIPATPPSANGTPGATPPGWFLVAHLLTYTWPNGHQDQLRAVGATWATASTALSSAADQLSGPIGDISALSSNEVESAVTTCCDVQRSVRELSNACHVLSFACDDYAQHLDDAHSTVLRELAVLVAETAVIEIVGAVAAGPSAGAAEVGAQGLVAARAATTAAKVATALARLEGLVTALATVTREAITTIAGVAATNVAAQALGAGSAVGQVAAAAVPSALAVRLAAAVTFYGGRLPLEGGGPPNGILVKRAPDGSVTNYATYDADGYAVKRVDLTGRSHGNIPVPHTVEYTRKSIPGPVRFASVSDRCGPRLPTRCHDEISDRLRGCPELHR